MAYFSIDIQVKGVLTLKRSEVNSIIKEAFYLTGLRWRRLYLPLHFGPRATQRYGYQKRSAQYRHRKKLAGVQKGPLEFTGEGKREALASERVIATRNSARMPLPRKFNYRPKGGTIRMHDEIRTVRDDERRDLTRFLTSHIRNTLQASGERKARVTGSLQQL